MPITTGEVERIRAAGEELLQGSATIHVFSTVRSEGGGTRDVYTPGATVDCRIAPVGGGEGGSSGDRVDARTTHVVTVPTNTAVTAKDRLDVAGVGMFEITAVRKRTFDEMVRRVEVREVA